MSDSTSSTTPENGTTLVRLAEEIAASACNTMRIDADSPFANKNIIVDSSALLILQFPVSKHLKAENRRNSLQHYLDVLPRLAEEGYHIIIPEIVACELGILAHGKAVNDYFPRNDGDRRYWHPLLDKFLKNVYAGKYPNIEIVPTDEPAEAAAYIKKLNALAIKYTFPCALATKAFVSVQSSYKNNMADKGIMALAHRCPSTKKTIVLANNKEALESISGRGHITLLNTNGLINAVFHSGLAAGMGIHPSITAQDFCRDCWRPDEPAVTWRVDHFSGENVGRSAKHYPFKEELTHHMRRKPVDAPSVADDERDAPKAVSRVQRFNEKFGNNWQTKLKGENPPTKPHGPSTP